MATKDNSSSMIGLGVKLAVGLTVLGMVGCGISKSVMTVGADEIVVHQSFFNGHLSVWNDSGVHGQWFGNITRYKKSAQYSFSAPKPTKNEKGEVVASTEPDESIKVRFSDGAHSFISGSLRYNLPTDEKHMLLLHSTYGSMGAIDRDLVKQVVAKSVYMTGPLMSSRESYAEKRNDLISFITDQILGGVYKTEKQQTETTDVLTGQKKMVDFVVPKSGDGLNGIEREEKSPMDQYGIVASNITITSIEYDPAIEAQIKTQQEAIQSVQQSIINSRKAEQDKITTELQGAADAAKSKWLQEVEKAKAVTIAQQESEVAVTNANKDKQVAALALETARLQAQTTVTAAKADADAKRLSVTANNNFNDRLQAFVDIQKAWAQAYGAQRQVPDTVVGGSGTNGNGFNQGLSDLFMTKTARDLSLQPHP